MLRHSNHDLLHYLFVKSAACGLVPNIEKEKDIKEAYASHTSSSTFSSSFFNSPIGIGSGLLKEEAGAFDSLIDMGEYAYIELGPVAIDPQHQPSLKTKMIRIDLENGKVIHKYEKSRYSCTQLVYRIL